MHIGALGFFVVVPLTSPRRILFTSHYTYTKENSTTVEQASCARDVLQQRPHELDPLGSSCAYYCFLKHIL